MGEGVTTEAMGGIASRVRGGDGAGLETAHGRSGNR